MSLDIGFLLFVVGFGIGAFGYLLGHQAGMREAKRLYGLTDNRDEDAT